MSSLTALLGWGAMYSMVLKYFPWKAVFAACIAWNFITSGVTFLRLSSNSCFSIRSSASFAFFSRSRVPCSLNFCVTYYASTTFCFSLARKIVWSKPATTVAWLISSKVIWAVFSAFLTLISNSFLILSYSCCNFVIFSSSILIYSFI